MPGQRGVARRTFPRRRIRRTRIKSGYPVYVRRFKMLLFAKQGKGKFLVDPPSTAELDWELEVLDTLEQLVHADLEFKGVPSGQWEYYVGFTKRLWEARTKFASATFQLEKQSLLYEYTQRGLNPAVLTQIQNYAEEQAKVKISDVRIYPYADSFVTEDVPNDNYGGDPYLDIWSEVDEAERSFLKFLLNPITKPIASAFLRIYIWGTINLVPGSTDIECREVPTLEFGEYTITWNNQPAFGSLLATVAPAVGFIEFDVTDYVRTQKAGPGIATFCLKCAVENLPHEGGGSSAWSKENTEAGYPAPMLRVNYEVP